MTCSSLAAPLGDTAELHADGSFFTKLVMLRSGMVQVAVYAVHANSEQAGCQKFHKSD
ncbi:hypothetical protein JYT48_02095 [Mariprofundus ferrooxydans]|nr:hypothetical protein [Mariprofundus ferrooxydans]